MSARRRRNSEPLVYVVACGWCGKVLRVVETVDPKMAGKISHGICPNCQARVIRDALAERAKKNPRRAR